MNNTSLKFALDDFALSLAKLTAPSQHVWVGSGYTTVQPAPATVMGVGEFHAPPFAALDFGLQIGLLVGGTTLGQDTVHEIDDTGDRGKGDVGLLYAGGVWRPHQIERHGTYHHFVDAQLLSLGVTSRLTPLANRAGFVLEIELTNRGDAPLSVAVDPRVAPGSPRLIPFDQWLFSTPKRTGAAAVDASRRAGRMTKSSCTCWTRTWPWICVPATAVAPGSPSWPPHQG